jgi:hypothetical protein
VGRVGEETEPMPRGKSERNPGEPEEWAGFYDNPEE